MKSIKKTYPSSNYPYYLLKKIILPDAENKKELIILNDDFLTDLLLFSVSPNDENKSNNK
jgi:hypothetical protein